MTTLTVALPKGRLQTEASALFVEAFDVDPAAALSRSRRLSWTAPKGDLEFLSVRAADVAAYVERGAADVGVVGADVLREDEPDLYEPLDLGIGACRMILAAPEGRVLPVDRPVRLATKYPRITTAWAAALGRPVELVPLHGAIELAPRLEVADAVVDITETGHTLAANGLVILEDVMSVTARLVVNRVSLKRDPQRVRAFVSALAAAGSRS